jgi:hypothetical protein
VPVSCPHPFLCHKAKFKAIVSSRKVVDPFGKTAKQRRGLEVKTGGVGELE